MIGLGWTAVYTQISGCDTESWLRMRSPDESGFGIYAKPGDKFPLLSEWQILQEQYDGLYYVMIVTYVWYEKPSVK